MSENVKLLSSSYVDQTKGIFVVSDFFFLLPLAFDNVITNKREQLKGPGTCREFLRRRGSNIKKGAYGLDSFIKYYDSFIKW